MHKVLNNQTHKNVKIKPFDNFDFIKDQHLIPISLHEFIQTAGYLPIIFVKGSDEEGYTAVTMMGLKPSENLMVVDGEWQGTYLPRGIASYPFSIGRMPSQKEGEDNFTLTIDEESPIISQDEGQSLFDSDAEATDFLKQRETFLKDHFNNMQQTHDVIQYFGAKGLIKEHSLEISLGDKTPPITISGTHVFDEDALNALPSEEFEDLRKRGFLPLIYAQLASIHQINKLIHLMSVAAEKAAS